MMTPHERFDDFFRYLRGQGWLAPDSAHWTRAMMMIGGAVHVPGMCAVYAAARFRAANDNRGGSR